jgi:hypothetical protein
MTDTSSEIRNCKYSRSTANQFLTFNIARVNSGKVSAGCPSGASYHRVFAMVNQCKQEHKSAELHMNTSSKIKPGIKFVENCYCRERWRMTHLVQKEKKHHNPIGHDIWKRRESTITFLQPKQQQTTLS